jgi:hypothetical protein
VNKKTAVTAARAALDARQVTPMSQPNRKIAYTASDTLRKLGYQWDEAAEAWRLAAAPPVPQTQRPVRLTDERIDAAHRTEKLAIIALMHHDISVENFTWALRLLARAVEAEVLRLNGIGGDV